MQKFSVLLLLVFFAGIASGQLSRGTFHSSVIPSTHTNSTTDIAEFIKPRYKNDVDKLGFIYNWVISNITYDTDSMYYINWTKGKDAKVSDALRRRKGVCENFAAIFTDIALKSGLTAFMIQGYTKQNGSIDRSGHSWSAVKLEKEWFLFDPTWDKDARDQLKYFMITPSEMILSHIPFDPLWQLLDYPISYKEFNKGSDSEKKKYLNYKDSINNFISLNELQQLEHSVKRMEQETEKNEIVNNQIAYLKMQIGIIYEEKDMNLYNSAVADLNNATNMYNKFVLFRNNQSVTVKTIEYVNELMGPAVSSINLAYQKINRLTAANYQYDPSSLIDRLNNLKDKIEVQQKYVKAIISFGDGNKY